MDVAISLSSEDSADALRSLRGTLVAEPELRGRVRLVERPPQPGELGTLTDLVSVAIGPGAGVTALATILITWLRSRTSEVNIAVTSENGASVTMSASHVHRKDMAEQQQLIRDLVDEFATGDAPQSGTTERATGESTPTGTTPPTAEG